MLHTVNFIQLFIKQKKAIWIVTGTKWNAHTGPLFIEIRLFTVFNINRLQTCCFMYKISRVALPLYFLNLFVLNNQVHFHNTRQAEKFHVISHKTNVRAFSIQVFGFKLWNDFNLNLTNCQTLAIL